MKRVIYALVCALCLIACTPNTPEYQMGGTWRMMPSGHMYIKLNPQNMTAILTSSFTTSGGMGTMGYQETARTEDQGTWKIVDGVGALIIYDNGECDLLKFDGECQSYIDIDFYYRGFSDFSTTVTHYSHVKKWKR